MTAKDGQNLQWGLASLNGTRAAAGAPFPALTNGEGGPPLVDENGIVWVRPIGGSPPEPGFTQRWQEHLLGGALLDDAEIRGTVDPANQFILTQVSGFIEAASDSVNYVQLFNKTGAPTSGVDVPQQSIRIVGSQNYSWSPGMYRFPDGIRWAISTTPAIYTSGTTANGWYNALGWESLP